MEKAIVVKNEEFLSVILNISDREIVEIGKNVNEINKNAYMNGYNWEVFLNYYLQENASELLIGIQTDPEAGMYAAYYDNSSENEIRAEQLANTINYLLENEEEIYRIVRDNGEEIEWD